ncbi:MAG TPA: hypothetical protein VF427_02130 [Noviherbaspirillum sp.]
MSNLNEKPAVETSCKPLWIYAFIVLGGCAACAFAALTLFSSLFEQSKPLTAPPPASNETESGHDKFISPDEARTQRLSAAKPVVSGMFVKDPYGCAYMFQYLSARLSVTPVLDEHKRPICDK